MRLRLFSLLFANARRAWPVGLQSHTGRPLAANPQTPLVSIGPSGIGGAFNREIFPDNIVTRTDAGLVQTAEPLGTRDP